MNTCTASISRLDEVRVWRTFSKERYTRPDPAVDLRITKVEICWLLNRHLIVPPTRHKRF